MNIICKSIIKTDKNTREQISFHEKYANQIKKQLVV